jgi:mannose-6-phosphate isomerase-like protein (cupin superfamily)
MPSVVDLGAAFATFTQTWSPRIVGEVNGMHVKVARLSGAFEWHSHKVEDELFLVVEGVLLMHFRDRTERIEPGQFLIVPHGVEHLPETETAEVQVLLFEPASTVNTGDGPDTARTVRELHRLDG